MTGLIDIGESFVTADPNIQPDLVITETQPNRPPVAVNDAATTAPGKMVVISVLANDTDADGDGLAITSYNQGSHGTVVLETATGKLLYTPNAGFEGIDVFNYTIDDGYGGFATATVTVTVVKINPVPAITNISPSNIAVGGGAFQLEVNGRDFVVGSKVLWNGVERVTTFVSAIQLKAAILASDVTAAGSATVKVSNPTPGGGLSNGVIAIMGAPKLTTKATMTRNGSQVSVQVSVSNGGTIPATGVQITSAKLGSSEASGLPAVIGTIGVNETFNKVFVYTVSAGSSTYALKGTYDGGSFAANLRVTVP